MQSASFSPGHVFAGRFRVDEVIGVGHTTQVYLAFDESLNRPVVVKCLTDELEGYDDIRRRFQSRIVTTSGLHHPHLARVFDGGQESGRIFMVAEYLPGGSLEDELSRGLVLPPEEVARLGRDLASGLAVLHENGLVHGEITPSKVLFDGERMVRLSDVASAGLGVAFRSYVTGEDVRYFSPEQARGEIATAESDVYALALILFEVATGQRPFDGHSAEATLRTRAHQPLPARPELGTLDMLLALASIPDPTVRLTAAQFAERLSAVVLDGNDFVLPDMTPPPLLSAFAPVERRTSVGFQAPSAEDIVGAQPTSPEPSSLYDDEPAAPIVFLPTSTARRRRRPAFLVAAVALVVLVAAGAGAYVMGYFSSTHQLPSLVGLTLADASSVVKADGITLHEVGTASSSATPANAIVSQSPSAGTSVAQGSTVNVVVSTGPKYVMVSVPKGLVGATCAAATHALTAAHLLASCPATSAVTSTLPAGAVVRYVVNGLTNPLAVPTGSRVVLVTSKASGSTSVTTTSTTIPFSNHGPRAVPNVVGDTQSQVFAALHTAALYFASEGPGHGTALWKHVVSQSPAAGTVVPWHSTVIIHVTEH